MTAIGQAFATTTQGPPDEGNRLLARHAIAPPFDGVQMSISIRSTTHTDHPTDSIDALIARIERDGDYRILRRLSVPPCQGDLVRQPDRALALLLVGDCSRRRPASTTAGILATYDHLGVRDLVARLATETSGGTSDTTDAGTLHLPLTSVALERFASRIRLIIGYDAASVTSVLMQGSTELAAVPFVDLLQDIDWTDHGIDPLSLTDILISCGLFVDTCSAGDVCLAMAAALSRSTWPDATRPPFSQFLEAISRRSVRVEVSGPTYPHRDALKTRGYRWSGGTGKLRTGWFLTVPADVGTMEVAWVNGTLARHGVSAVMRPIDRRHDRDRLSVQIGPQ